ncbi:hypothetical protein ACNQKP_11915 [Bdellovibrio bacteriovorus]|uniref:hypothetical protein n=1 Tax=Bdellovibrio bacteriovorus TaxID=959 RepID=UPI003AA86661
MRHKAILYSDFNCPFCYALEERLVVKNLMPEIDIAFPIGKPNTLKAIQYSIAASRHEPLLGLVFRHTLAREFWVNGEDISDEAFIKTVAHQFQFDSLRVDSAGWACNRWKC